MPVPEAKKIQITGRKLHNIKIDDLCNYIKEACDEFNNAENDVDVEILSSHLDDMLKTLLDIHAPLILREIRNHPNCLWYKDEFRKAKKMKHRAERRYRKSHLTIHLDILKQQSKYYNELLKSAKSDYYKTKIGDCDTKSLFKTINSFFSISKNTKNYVLHIMDQNWILLIGSLNIIDIRDSLRLNRLDCQSQLCRTSETCLTTIKNFEYVSPHEIMKIISTTSNSTCHLDPLPVSTF